MNFNQAVFTEQLTVKEIDTPDFYTHDEALLLATIGQPMKCDEYILTNADKGYNLAIFGQNCYLAQKQAHDVIEAISDKWLETTYRSLWWQDYDKPSCFEDVCNQILEYIYALPNPPGRLIKRLEADLYRDFDTAFQPTLGLDPNDETDREGRKVSPFTPFLGIVFEQ